jgi:ribosomal protein L4
MIGILKALGLEGTTLIVAQAQDKNLLLASRNLPNVELTSGEMLTTYQVLKPAKLLFTRGAFELVEARLKA